MTSRSACRLLRNLCPLVLRRAEPLRRARKDRDQRSDDGRFQCIPEIEFNVKIATLVTTLKSERVDYRRQQPGPCEIGPPAKQAIPALIEALDDQTTECRRRCVPSRVRTPTHASPA
jgi:hypothetical protein